MNEISASSDKTEIRNFLYQDSSILIFLNRFEIDMLISQINSTYLADLIKINEQSFEKFVTSTGCPTPESYLRKLEGAMSDQELNYEQEQVMVLTREQWLMASLILGSFHTYLEAHSSCLSEIQFLKTKECVESLMSKIAAEIHVSKKRTLH